MIRITPEIQVKAVFFYGKTVLTVIRIARYILQKAVFVVETLLNHDPHHASYARKLVIILFDARSGTCLLVCVDNGNFGRHLGLVHDRITQVLSSDEIKNSIAPSS